MSIFLDNLEDKIVVGLIKASNSPFSSFLSLIETNLRQKITKSLDSNEFATLRNIFSKIEL